MSIYSLSRSTPMSFSFYAISADKLDDPEAMARDLEQQANGDKGMEDFQEINNYLERTKKVHEELELDPFEPLNASEQARRRELRHKVFYNISKDQQMRIKYDDHGVVDEGHRYFAEGIMKYTPDKDADKAYNLKVREYILMAQRGEFKNLKKETADPEIWAKREEFIQMHRDYLDRAVPFDMVEFAKSGITDEYCADHAAEIYRASLVGLQFENIQANFKNWGIEDPICTEKMDKYDSSGHLYDIAQNRLSIMACSSYPYMNESDAETVKEIMEQTRIDPEVSKPFLDLISLVPNTRFTALFGELQTALHMFERAGFDRNDVEVIDPGSPKDNPRYIPKKNISPDIIPNDHKLTFTVKGHHDIQLELDITPEMSLTKGDMIKAFSNAPVPKPKAPGFFQSIFNSIYKFFTGEDTESQKKYNTELRQYENSERIETILGPMIEENKQAKLRKPEESVDMAKEKNDLAKENVKEKIKENSAPDMQSEIDAQLKEIGHSVKQPNRTSEQIINDLTALTNITKANPTDERITNIGHQLSKDLANNIKTYEDAHPGEKIKLDDSLTREVKNLADRAKQFTQAKNPEKAKPVIAPTVKTSEAVTSEKKVNSL